MDTPIGVSDVKPTDCQSPLVTASRVDDCGKLGLVLCHTRNCWEKCLLQIRVKVTIETHVPQPPVLKNARKQLADCRGEYNWPEIAGR